MNPNSNDRLSQRIYYLDSIRGIAAMMVVFYHFIGWYSHESLSYKLSVFIFNGSDAVSFFFVLSGFVLAYPYLHLGRKLPYLKYVWRRILRLYPAYILTIVILAFSSIYSELSLDLAKEVFLENGRTRIWNELAMVLNVHDLYFPGWTLRVEVIYSLLIPALVMIAKKKRLLLVLIWLLSLFIGDVVLRMCMTHFLLGLVLAMIYPELSKLSFRSSPWYPYRWLIFFLMFVLFSLRHLREILPQTKTLFDQMWHMNIRWEHFSAVAAFIALVIIIMDKPTQRWLENKWLLFLGRISYSIYLIHWFVIILLMEQMGALRLLGTDVVSFVGLLLIYLFSTVFLAWLMYNWVERPFIRWSKKAVQ